MCGEERVRSVVLPRENVCKKKNCVSVCVCIYIKKFRKKKESEREIECPRCDIYKKIKRNLNEAR